MKTTIYTANKQTHFFKEVKEIIRDIRGSNFLAYQMAKRDIQAQYRQSIFGVVWAFIPIIVNSLVWIFLNSSGAVEVNVPKGIPYTLFVVIGATIWTMFVQSLTSPITSVNSGRGIMSKINFPKEALIVSGVYKMAFNLGMQLLVLGIFLWLFEVTPTRELLYFPLYLLIVLTFGLALGVLLAPVGLLYTDVGQLITLGAQFLMYVTPVAYSIPKVGRLKIFFEINPMTYLISDTRSSLTGLSVESLRFSLILFLCSIIVLVIGMVVLRKSMNIIIEKIS